MEKEQILSTLNEKLGTTGLSERTINDYIDAMIPVNEENVDFDKHVNFLKSLNGNFSADVAKQVNEFKKNYKPASEPVKDEPKKEEVPSWAQSLIDANKELKERLDKKESEIKQSELMSKVKAEMKRNGATDDYVLKQTLKGVTLDTEKSVAEHVKALMADYDSEYKACRGNGAAPRNGGGSGKQNPDKSEGAAFFERKYGKKDK